MQNGLREFYFKIHTINVLLKYDLTDRCSVGAL